MHFYLLKRVLSAIPVIWIIATLTFFMLRVAPGGPFDQEKNLPKNLEAALNAYYGLDKPLFTQYVDYLKMLLQGNLGPSFKHAGWSVNEILAEKLPVSFELGVWALLIALFFGILLGSIGAVFQHTLLDRCVSLGSMFGVCLPSFVLGPLFILLFAITFPYFNASGWVTASDRVLPAITLSCFYTAYISRLMRARLIEVLNQEYIRTAFAKGLSMTQVIIKHALKNSLTSVISYSGPALAGLIGGSFVIETIFHIPGMGQMFITAAFNRDYTLVLGAVLIYALAIIAFNLISDVLLVLINPRASFK